MHHSRTIASVMLLAGIILNARAATTSANQAGSQVAADVDARTVQYKSGDASISAYLAKPKGSGKFPAVIVVHDVGGLDNSAQDITRRLAGAGFVALAPNLLSRSAGAKTQQQQTSSSISQLPLSQPIGDLKAGLALLQQDPSVDSAKISVIGFGWGGWRAFKVLEDSPTLYRAVIFYGTTPVDDDNLAKIHAPILAHYAQYDYRVTGNALWTEKQLGSKFKFYVYPQADRGFIVGGGPDESANADAAKLAWTRTLEFLKP